MDTAETICSACEDEFDKAIQAEFENNPEIHNGQVLMAYIWSIYEWFESHKVVNPPGDMHILAAFVENVELRIRGEI